MEALYSTTLSRSGLETQVRSLQDKWFPNLPTTNVKYGRIKGDVIWLRSSSYLARCHLSEEELGSIVNLRSRIPIAYHVIAIFLIFMALGFLLAENVKANGHPASIGERLLGALVLVLTVIIGRAVLLSRHASFIRNVEVLLKLERMPDPKDQLSPN
ncbi:MAG: hypothetical protein ABI599_05330 [Flavobacteriales bacterium]